MRIAVVDLENNTPQNEWQKSLTERVEWAPIIEIGAVMLDIRSGKIISSFETFVNPNEAIFPEITALTGISDVETTGPNSGSLDVALDNFYQWMADNNCKLMAAWGRDCDEIEKQAIKSGIINKFKKLDIKSMFDVLKGGLSGKKMKGGLKGTLETFGLTFEGKQHRAKVDALNTAKLLFHAKEISLYADKIKEHKFRGLQE
jgi:inhibitor of KinA sporulation pathway (predicted exonuclease)